MNVKCESVCLCTEAGNDYKYSVNNSLSASPVFSPHQSHMQEHHLDNHTFETNY